MIGKQFFPSSLFGRALLILILPTVLIQLAMAYIFFDRHWDNVTRHMARALAGEAAFLVTQLKTHAPQNTLPQTVKDFDIATGLNVYLKPPDMFNEQTGNTEYPEFQEALRERIAQPFLIGKREGMIDIFVLLPNSMLHIEASAKRLESRTTILFVLWMCGITSVFLLIAIIFLRNQIRPIRKLAQAAEDFGRGVDMPDFRPSGATEVRVAARAFIVMRERIKRQIRTRTDMLAGISHDLRTPLTRMKLQLAMMQDAEAAKELAGDVQQMEHMIEEYLDFARGDVGEEAVHVNVRELVNEVVADYRRGGAEVSLSGADDCHAQLRVLAITRMLHNIIDNAVRYGTRCQVTLKKQTNVFELLVDDEGPGIPEAKYDEVFQPFRRLDPSRNVNTGGVGLGLTIARDIVLSHGGSISLGLSPKKGLRVTIRLPIAKGNA